MIHLMRPLTKMELISKYSNQ